MVSTDESALRCTFATRINRSNSSRSQPPSLQTGPNAEPKLHYTERSISSKRNELRFQRDHGFCRASILQPWFEQFYIRGQPLPARRRHLQRYQSKGDAPDGRLAVSKDPTPSQSDDHRRNLHLYTA